MGYIHFFAGICWVYFDGKLGKVPVPWVFEQILAWVFAVLSFFSLSFWSFVDKACFSGLTGVNMFLTFIILCPFQVRQLNTTSPHVPPLYMPPIRQLNTTTFWFELSHLSKDNLEGSSRLCWGNLIYGFVDRFMPSWFLLSQSSN